MSESAISKSAQQFPEKPWIVRPQVSGELFTDREEHLKYFYESALDTASGRSMSAVLMGAATHGQNGNLSPRRQPSLL